MGAYRLYSDRDIIGHLIIAFLWSHRGIDESPTSFVCTVIVSRGVSPLCERSEVERDGSGRRFAWRCESSRGCSR